LNGDDLKELTAQYSRLDQSLTDIRATQGRQEKALVDLFKESRKTGANIASLDTVVRMSLAQQKRINQECQGDIKELQGSTDERARAMERKLAYFAGGMAVLLIVFDLAARYLLKLI